MLHHPDQFLEPVIPFEHFVFVKRVIEGKHGNAVLHGRKTAHKFNTDALCGRIRNGQIREFLFQVHQLAVEPIVVLVRHFRLR